MRVHFLVLTVSESELFDEGESQELGVCRSSSLLEESSHPGLSDGQTGVGVPGGAPGRISGHFQLHLTPSIRSGLRWRMEDFKIVKLGQSKVPCRPRNSRVFL